MISVFTDDIVVDEIISWKVVYSCNGIMDNKEISNTSNIYVIFRLWCIIVSGQIWCKFIEYDSNKVLTR